MWASQQIPVQDHARFIRDARDYSLLNGLVLRYDELSNDNCVGHIPFTLFPSPFPRRLYQECLDIQPLVNNLMLAIANDRSFMNEVLQPVARVDDFTRKLLDINDKVQHEGLAQTMISCISRADYMLHRSTEKPDGKLEVRQVEVNAIASAMSAHSFTMKSLQDYLTSKYDYNKPDDSIFPSNNALDLVSGGLIDAFEAYGKSSAYILLVNEERSMNFSDQTIIELRVKKLRPDIKIIRKSFISLPAVLKLGPNKELLLEETKEIGLIYFRYCYDPSNYNFDEAWDLRLLMERSRAIKCPSINFHLSGAKKFQQVLHNQERLERFLNADQAKRLAKVFCKFWSIGSSNDAQFNELINGANKLVLKPQREGGGHNIFGPDIKPFVQMIADTEERSQYILMEYIDGPREKNWLLLHNDDPRLDVLKLRSCDQIVSELGIFGSILADAKTSVITTNKSAGYLVRSKRYGVNEGGVASGYAGLSNLLLVDDHQVPYDPTIYYHEISE